MRMLTFIDRKYDNSEGSTGPVSKLIKLHMLAHIFAGSPELSLSIWQYAGSYIC